MEQDINKHVSEDIENIRISDATDVQVEPHFSQTEVNQDATYSVNKVARISFYVLLSLPFVGFAIAVVGSGSGEERQYSGLVLLLLAAYNIPALATSGISYLAASHLVSKQSFSSAKICFGVSIFCSILGIAFMAFNLIASNF